MYWCTGAALTSSKLEVWISLSIRGIRPSSLRLNFSPSTSANSPHIWVPSRRRAIYNNPKTQIRKTVTFNSSTFRRKARDTTDLLACKPVVDQGKHGILMLQIQLSQQWLDCQGGHFLTRPRVVVEDYQRQRHKEQTTVLQQEILWIENIHVTENKKTIILCFVWLKRKRYLP